MCSISSGPILDLDYPALLGYDPKPLTHTHTHTHTHTQAHTDIWKRARALWHTNLCKKKRARKKNIFPFFCGLCVSTGKCRPCFLWCPTPCAVHDNRQRSKGYARLAVRRFVHLSKVNRLPKAGRPPHHNDQPLRRPGVPTAVTFQRFLRLSLWTSFRGNTPSSELALHWAWLVPLLFLFLVARNLFSLNKLSMYSLVWCWLSFQQHFYEVWFQYFLIVRRMAALVDGVLTVGQQEGETMIILSDGLKNVMFDDFDCSLGLSSWSTIPVGHQTQVG